MNEISGPAANLPEPWNEQARVESAIRPRIALTPSPTSANSIDAMGLLTAFRRRWRLALGLAFLGMCLIGAGVWFFAPPPKFIAEALLLVEAEQPRIIASTKEYQVDPITDRATQVALIKSLVVSKVLTKPEIAKLELFKSRVDPAAWLVSELKAEFSGKMLRLALSSDDPAAAATVIKAITQVYLTEVANKEKTQRIERNVTLEKHYDDLQKRLEKKRALLKGLATDLGAKDKQALSLQQRLAISRQSMAEEELLQTQADLKHAMAELKILQKKEERSAEAVEPSSNVRTKARNRPARTRESDEAGRKPPEVSATRSELDGDLRAFPAHCAGAPLILPCNGPSKNCFRPGNGERNMRIACAPVFALSKRPNRPTPSKRSRASLRSRIRLRSSPSLSETSPQKSPNMWPIRENLGRKPSRWSRSRKKSIAPTKWSS